MIAKITAVARADSQGQMGFSGVTQLADASRMLTSRKRVAAKNKEAGNR